jgi:hypothetical protein
MLDMKALCHDLGCMLVAAVQDYQGSRVLCTQQRYRAAVEGLLILSLGRIAVRVNVSETQRRPRHQWCEWSSNRRMLSGSV